MNLNRKPGKFCGHKMVYFSQVEGKRNTHVRRELETKE